MELTYPWTGHQNKRPGDRAVPRLGPGRGIQSRRSPRSPEETRPTPTSARWGFASSAELWFQSFQNWQSEFLAVFALAVLGIFLRQRGSPESKPVAAPHSQRGNG
jgi:hypothetical protein